MHWIIVGILIGIGIMCAPIVVRAGATLLYDGATILIKLSPSSL
jgi:hypothetical protein